MAFRSKEDNIVVRLNNVQPGLNFLVPVFWWDQLYLKNTRTKQIHQLVMPENAPLDSLIELQIIKAPLTSYDDDFAHLMDKCQKSSVSITKQLKVCREQEKPQQNGKRARPSYDWWKSYMPESQGNYHKIMYSPYINLDTARNMGWQDDFQWRVVSPMLYKLIHKHEAFTKGQPYDTSLVAIPIFLSEGVYSPVSSYKLIQRHFTSVYFCNFNKFDYCFMGYIEEHVRYGDLLNGLYEGLELLSDKCNSIYKESRRNKIYYIDHEIYCQFYDQDDYPQKLGWRQFAALAQGTVDRNNNIKQIVEYSYYSEECAEDKQNQTQMVEETEQVGMGGRKPTKKIKQNEQLHHTQKKQGFYAVVQPRDRPYTPYIINDGHYAPSQIEVIANVPDVPSSTQGQTPEEMILEKPFRELPKQDHSRIAFPLWSGQSVASFRKVSELRQNNFIPTLKPFRGHTDRLVLRDGNNKKVYFQTNCNKLKRNGEDQLVEEEVIPQVMDENSVIAQDICGYLEGLALNVSGRHQNALQMQKEEQKQQEAQFGKKELDLDSQTCKNEDIDSEASRQY